MSLKASVIFLQVLAGFLIAMGFFAAVGGILWPRPVSCFGLMVPAALVAMPVMGIGVYFWMRASKLKQRIVSGAGL